MYKQGEPILYEKLSWDEAAKFGQDPGLILIAPGGLEQSGPHMSMDTPASINFEICKRISAKLGVPVLPKIMPGVSQPHGFPGTVWLKPKTFAAYMYDTIRSLIIETGFRQFLLLNGNIWNQGPLLSVRDNIRCDYRDVQIRLLNWWSFNMEVYRLLTEDSPLGRNIQSNKGITSCMLAIDPEHQNMVKAKQLKVNLPEEEYFWDYRTEQVSVTGAIGNAITEATPELGEKIISLATDKLLELLVPAMQEKPRFVRRAKHPGIDY